MEAAREALTNAEDEVRELEASIADLRTQKDQLLASEPAEGRGEASREPRMPDWTVLEFKAFTETFQRLAAVIEALPRAHHAGNMEAAYDGLMGSLHELAAFGPHLPPVIMSMAHVSSMNVQEVLLFCIVLASLFISLDPSRFSRHQLVCVRVFRL